LIKTKRKEKKSEDNFMKARMSSTGI